MKNERLLNAFGQVKEEYIEEAAPKKIAEASPVVVKKKNYSWIKWGALAASLCIVAGLGVKLALPMFKPVDDIASNENNTGITTVDDAFTTVDTTIQTANTEALKKPNPEEDVDTNIGTTLENDQGFPDWGLTLSVKNVTSTGLTLVCTQSGGNPTGELMTGEPYRLITLVDETWKNVEELPLPEGVDGRAWNSIGYPISKSETREFEINWEWMFGELPEGTYRLIKEFMDFRKTADYDTADYWVEFVIQ